MARKAKRKARPFDAAKYLDSDGAIVEYIAEILLTRESDLIAHGIAVVSRACDGRRAR